MIPNQDNGDGSDNGWAAATISAIFLPGLLGFTFDPNDHDDHYHYDDDHDYFDFHHFDYFHLSRNDLICAEAAVYIYSYLHGDLKGSRGAQLR